MIDEMITETEQAEQEKDGQLSNKDGWIQVKMQQITVHQPGNGGNLPVIDFKPPIKLSINDIELSSKTPVTSKDIIQWEIEEKPLFEITVSKDSLFVYFRLDAKERYAWTLVETEPANQVTISAVEDKNNIVDTVDLHDVIARLSEMSITAPPDIAAIHAELGNPTYRPVIVAKGREPIAGKDAQLLLYFSQQVESQFFEIGGSIDYRNHLQIPSVKKAEVIAKKEPCVEGIPGYDVYGKVIMPDKPKDIVVNTTENAELTPDGEIISLIEGRPSITGHIIKTFDILTSYIVTGDVDIESGNIVFSGDVIVHGNVTDNMIIESLGNVYVYGSVFNATITATGSIHTRGNVVGSKLYSGYFGVMFNRLYNSTKLLDGHMKQILAASQTLLQTLESRNQKIPFGQIVQLLMENKFKETLTALKDLLNIISNIQHLKKEKYQQLKDMCEILLQPTQSLETATVDLINGLQSLLQETYQELERTQEELVEININQCHNSELKSNGNIMIHREGVLLSDLYSAGNITFKHKLAICRGSQLEAEQSIEAGIVGGQTGTLTVLKAKKYVSVRKMYLGQVCIGQFCTDIDDVIENRIFEMKTMKTTKTS